MTKKIRNIILSGYDALADTYDYDYGQNKDQELYLGLKWLINKLKNGSSILDVGSGTGQVARILSKNFEVIGIDNSTFMIKIAKMNAPKATFIEMNLNKLMFDEKHFDAILTYFTLLHVEKSIFKRTILTLLNHLNIGGFFIISMILGNHDRKELLMGRKYHFAAYSEDVLLDILISVGLKVLKVRKQQFQPKIEETDIENQIFIYCQK